MGLESFRAKALLLLKAIAGPGNRWRTIALLFLFANYKNLPFIWHIRFFGGAITHTIRPKIVPRDASSHAYPLFLPLITSTRAPIAECDYNVHKSNSTYFSDLDVSRTHLTSLLCSPGLKDYQRRRRTGEAAGPLLIGLGGVACFFLKEIKPYEGYELWTRVLCWDKKWVYTVTHFVRKGVVVPEGYLLGKPWFGGKSRKSRGSTEAEIKEADQKDIFACAISKYVFKYGRKTVPPEAVFERCGQLPPRPADSAPTESTATLTPESTDGLQENVGGLLDEPSKVSAEVLAQGSLEPAPKGQGEWTWEMVEQERKRGMEIAHNMLGLDKLKEEFTGSTKPALGAYRDLLWV